MTDILSIMNKLSLVLQKKGAPLTLNKFRKLAEADSPDKYIDISAPTKSYYAAYQEYINILTDLGETRKSLFSGEPNKHSKLSLQCSDTTN